MGEALRKVGRVALWTLGGVVALLALVLLLLQTPYAKDWIRAEIVSQVNASLAGRVDAKRLSGTLFWSASLEDVSLEDGRGRPAAHVERIDAGYSLLSLLWGVLEIDRVTIVSPRVVIRRYSDGTFNVATLVEPGPPSEPSRPSEFRISISDYELQNGTVIWEDQPVLDDRDVDLASVDSLVDRIVSGEPEGAGEALEAFAGRMEALSPGRTSHPGLGIADELTVRGHGSVLFTPEVENVLETLHVGLRTETLPDRITVEGSKLVTHYDPRRLTNSLEELRLSPFDTQLRGLAFDLGLAPDSPESAVDEFWAHIETAKVSKKLPNYVLDSDLLTSDVEATITAGGAFDDLFAIQSLTFAEGGSADVAGRLDATGERLAYRADVRATDIDSSKLVRSPWPAVQLNTAATVKGRGTTLESIAGEATVSVWNSTVGKFDVDRMTATAAASDRTIRLKKFGLQSSFLKAAATGSVGLDGEFELHAKSRSKKKELSAKRLGLQVPTDVSVGRANVDIDASGRLDYEAETILGYADRLDAETRWRLGGIDIPGFRVDRSEGNVDVRAVPTGPDERRRDIGFDLRADGAGVRVPGLSLRSGDVEMQGDATIDYPPEASLTAIRRISSDYSAEVRRLRMPGIGIGSGGFSGSLQSKETAGEFEASMEFNLGAGDFGGLRVAAASGSVDSNLTVDSEAPIIPIGRISLRGNVETERIEIAGISVARTRSDVDLEGAPLDPSGRISIDGSEGTIGSRRFSTLHVDIDAREDRRVTLDASAAPDKGPERPYTLASSLGYTEDLRTFEFDRLEFGRADQTWRLAKAFELVLDTPAITIRELRLVRARQSIELDGTYRPADRQSIQLDLENFDIGDAQDLVDYHPVENLDGVLTIDLALEGTTRRPDLTMSTNLRDFTAAGYGPIELDGDFESDGERVRIERFEAMAGDIRIGKASADLPISWNLEGDATMHTDRAGEIHFELGRARLEDIAEYAPQLEMLPVSGGVEGTFDFRGTVQDPSIDAEFRLEGVSVETSVGETSFSIAQIDTETTLHYGDRAKGKRRIDFQSHVDWQDTRIVSVALLTDASLVEWGIARAEGELSLIDFLNRISHAPLQFAFTLEQTDLATVPLAQFQQADAEGRLSGKFTLDGTMVDPDATAVIDLDDFGWNQYRDIFVDLRSHLKEGALHLETFRVEWDADEVLVARGTVPLPFEKLALGQPLDNLPIDFAVELKPIPIAKLAAIDYAFTQFQGTLSGYLRAKGSLRSPDIDGRFAVVDALFSEDHRGSIGVWMHADRTGVDGGTLFCQNELPILTGQFDVPLNLDLVQVASGTSPLVASGEIEASLEGKNVPIKQLVPNPLVRETIDNATGYLHVDLSVSGTWQDLHPSGRLEIENGAVTLVEYGRRFRNIDMVTTFDDKLITLESFKVVESSGKAQANGEVKLGGFIPESFEFDAKTDDFNVGGFATDFPALVSSESTIEGELSEEVNRADIEVTDLNVELPETDEAGRHPTTLSEDIVVVSEHGQQMEEDEISTFLTRGTGGADVTRWEIAVKVERNSFVRHPNGFLNFAADLQADLQGTRALVTGQIDAVRGDFEFLGRDFRVEQKEGIVRFTGASPPNPRLDVVAIHPLDRSVVAELDRGTEEDPHISVRVGGTAREPTLDMTSRPTMSESEIIFVLMTGRPPTTADPGQEEGVASQAAAAAGGIFSALIQQKISRTLPVDVFRFESGRGGLGGSRLRVGKYVTSDLFVSYAYKFGGDEEEESGGEARVEYHFLPRWLIEAKYGDNQTGELNVFWDVY